MRPDKAKMLLVRIVAVGLALTTFMPWFTSRGIFDSDPYTGNPFPLVDWVVAGAAMACAVLPRLAKTAAIIAAVSIVVTLLALYVDTAEGLDSSIEYGVVLAALASVLLWLPSRRPKGVRSSRHRRGRSSPR